MFHIDYETFSEADLPSVGGWRYAFDPSTEILCCALAKGEQQPLIWVPPSYRSTFPASHDWTAADTLLQELAASNEPVYAHNAVGFEVPITDALWRKTTGLPPIAHSRWRCTAVMARRAALPHSLAKCAEKLGLANQKDNKGSALIRKLSLLQKDGKRIRPTDDPEAFRQFCDYCLQDVRVEQEIHKKLKAFELKGFDLEVFQTDLEINARGLPVNLKALENAQKIVEEASTKAAKEFKALTGLDPTQTQKFLDWLKDRGYEHENLRSATIDEFLDQNDTDPGGEVGKALQLRKRVSFAAVKKVSAMLKCAGPHDNKVRGTLMYYGAIRTGRWSGSLVQPQNFRRPTKALLGNYNWKAAGDSDEDAAIAKMSDRVYRDIERGMNAEALELVYDTPLETMASAIRHFIDDGKPMLNADYSAIEARVMAWIAGEEWRMEVFRGDGKIYEASACQMFKLKRSEVTKSIRARSKVAELALQFRGGVGAMKNMGALKMGIAEEELQPIVDAWRAANPMIVAYWNVTEKAVESAVANPGTSYSVWGGKATYFCARTAGINYLFCRLPSGRVLSYPEPRFETVEMPWGDMREVVTFWGQLKGKTTWGRIPLSSNVACENVVQATAADFMAHGAVNCSKHGYRINALIHDEALSHYDKGQSIEEFTSLLTTLPDWAKGFPLRAEGEVVPYYKK